MFQFVSFIVLIVYYSVSDYTCIFLVVCWCTFGFFKLTHKTAATATIAFDALLIFCSFSFISNTTIVYVLLAHSRFSISNLQGCFLLSVLFIFVQFEWICGSLVCTMHMHLYILNESFFPHKVVFSHFIRIQC